MHTKANKNISVAKRSTPIILAALLFGLLNFPANAAPNVAPGGQRLRNLAGSFLIGYASRNDFWSMSDAAQYQEVARTEFNFMTPENAMKWDATEPSQNNFTFGQADQHDDQLNRRLRAAAGRQDYLQGRRHHRRGRIRSPAWGWASFLRAGVSSRT